MKWNVLKRGLTSGAAYDASVLDYYNNVLKLYEEAKRQQEEYERNKREYEKQLKDRLEKKAKEERDRKEYLEKLRKDTLPEERELAAVRALKKWENGETPDKRDLDLFEISDYKKSLPNANNEAEWYEKAWRKVKDFFLSNDGITATGWKVNNIQASQFSGNLASSKEDQQLINMAEDYFKGNKTPQNAEAIRELNKRKPGLLNTAAVYVNKALNWIGNNNITGTTGAFLGTNELDKLRMNIDFDENTLSDQALQNIASLRNSYKAFDEESYNAYLENKNKARYYENLLSSEQKRKIDIAEGILPDENGNIDGSVEFFNFGKLKYQLPGIIAGSISSPALMIGSLATGIATAYGIAATTAAAGAAMIGTGGLAGIVAPALLTAVGAGATFGLNLASGSHENAAEVDEGYVSKVRYLLDKHPKIAADFYKRGRSVLGESATEEEIITAKLANKVPSANTIVEKAFNDAAIGSQRLFDRDMVATTLDSTIDTALEITPIKFFSTIGKSAIKANLRSTRISRAANKVLSGGDGGVLRNAFAKYGSLVSVPTGAIGGGAGFVLDNTIGRIPKVGTAIKAMGEFDIAKIRRLGPKASNWLEFAGAVVKRGAQSAVSEGIEEGKQYYNQQRALLEFITGLKDGNLSYETQSIIGDVLDDFQAGNFAAAGLMQAVTGVPLLDYLHYTDENIIDAAEAIKNIKSGMIGGHAQTTLMTAINGAALTIGTHGVIDDMELAIRALEENKLKAQRLFAVDEVLSRTDRKYIANAIEYLKNSNSIKLSEQELEDLLHRATEVKGISNSKQMKRLAEQLGISKEDYHKFVADYMYHKDILEDERENKRNSERDLNIEANKVLVNSKNIINPSDDIAERWSENDLLNEKSVFEKDKLAKTKTLEDRLLTLKDKLEKLALTRREKKDVEDQISETEKSLKEVNESKFDESKKKSYAEARFDRINTVARIRGVVKQLEFLNTMLAAIPESNVSGKKFFQGQITSTKNLLNSMLTGNKLHGKQLTADNLSLVDEFINAIATLIELGDLDNEYLLGASAELTAQINSLAQAYQERAKATLDYNIAKNLFNDFLGYYTKDGEIVKEGTEGSKYVEGNAKTHLEGILSAQDDDASLELAFQQGFSDYGFSGVYKDESPLVAEEEREEEEAHPGTSERRNRIKQLKRKIRNFASKTKDYISGKWKSFGHKKVFVPDEPDDRSMPDPSEDALDRNELYSKLIEDYKESDDANKWLNKQVYDDDVDGMISNSQSLIDAFLSTMNLPDDLLYFYNEYGLSVDVFYKGHRIGRVFTLVVSNKADGAFENIIDIKAEGFDLNKIEDAEYLETLIKDGSDKDSDGSSSDGHDSLGPLNISEQQETKIQLLRELSEKTNAKFDTSLRTSSHYFEWVGTGENRKLRLWHRLHDEIGSHFKQEPQNKKNWSQQIKDLYAVVYHKGYSKESQEGVKDIQALLDHLRNFYKTDQMNERLLDRISGYVIYLEQEGDNISDTDLYECIKGISEEIAPENKSNSGSMILNRGTAIDVMCRTIFGMNFSSKEEAVSYCKTLEMEDKAGNTVLVKDYFTDEAFEDAVRHLVDVKLVYTEHLGYVLWTAPFTIYTEDLVGKNGNVRIAGEVDMLAIDKDGNAIIIDFKTSKNPFFLNGEISPSFKTPADNLIKSPKEQYTIQQSAYVQMLTETSRKETNDKEGLSCNEIRLLPVRLNSSNLKNSVNKVTIEFSKDLQLILEIIPFKELGENIIIKTEDYRNKLALISAMYAKVDYIATSLNIYYRNDGQSELAKQIRNIKESLDSILLCLQEVTSQDLALYWLQLDGAIRSMEESYLGNKETIDRICTKYRSGELELSEEDKARDYNNLDWNDSINENDIDKLGGFSGMGVKDRKEYDEKVEELAHVACERNFLKDATAKLTAILYKTRRGNDKIAVYASITYNGTTYPPIRIYLSLTKGELFAKDVLAGNIVSANVNTTVGLLSRCSDGKQHAIGDNELLIGAIGGTKENPYLNFMVDADNNDRVAIVTFNENTGSLTTVSSLPENETRISLPKNIKKESTNGHIIINVVPEVSGSGNPIPIICNTKQLDSNTGKDLANHRTQSLLDFLVEVVLSGINDIEHSQPLKEKITINDEQIPLTYELVLNFFFEPFNPDKGSYILRPQYTIVPMPNNKRGIKIGNFSKNAKNPARIISLDDTKALRDAISKLSIWISIEMASVQWSSGKPGSKLFNEFSKFLRNLQDGERFYLGETGIYFDKSDADGTFLGFLAKNGLLTTPFNGFSHPLISINSSRKDDGITPPAIIDDEPSGDGNIGPTLPLEPGKHGEDDKYAAYDAMYNVDEDDSFMPIVEGEEDPLDSYDKESRDARRENDRNPANIAFNKLLNDRSKLDETAARQYIEKVLGKNFVDNNLEFVDEISSAIVGGLSMGVIIAGQVTANMMKLSHYAQNGVEYHESFHWVFELIMDPRESKKIRNIVRKKYGIVNQREISEWLADAYMYYVRNVYVPNGTLLLKTFAKIKSWGITFRSIFTGEYLMYKLFNHINSGKFANKPINNEAVLRFLKKLVELNQTIPTTGFEKDGVAYKYQQGPIDHELNIKQIAFFALNTAAFSPAARYVKNGTITVNIKSLLDRNFVKKVMMLDHYEDGKLVKGFSTEELVKDSQNPKHRTSWYAINNALGLRELLSDEHIDDTNKYVMAYIDKIIGIKGKDLSIHGLDDSSDETNFDLSYADVEDGDVSFAGSPKEHIIPDHLISRMSKTSSRIKLFFGTIPNFLPNEFGKFGYYDLHYIYLTVQNRYHYVMSPEELWKAIENDSRGNVMIKSLWKLISELKKLVNGDNKAYSENAAGLLNEIYKNIKSTKQSHEVIKTRRDPNSNWITYRSVNIMVQNNSYAISRDFTETVLGGFNKFYKPVMIKENGKETRGIVVNNNIRDEITDRRLTAQYRTDAYEDFFGSDYKTFTDDTEGIKLKKIVWPIYNVLISYGTENQKPLYIKYGGKYVEVSVEKNLGYIKFKFIEALSSIGIDITEELLDDILETQFGGTGALLMKQFFRQTFVLPAKGNSHKAGSKVTIRDAVDALYTQIQSELSLGNGVIRSNRLVEKPWGIDHVDGTSVFRNQKIHSIMSILIATAQQEKYEVSARAVDGKLTYAMSDDNTVTAMCDVIFNKTGDPLCTKIRLTIINDPFNMSMGEGLFRNMPVGSYILPRIDDDNVDYEIVNDGGIETGNNENSSTNSDKRGADTIMGKITKLCQNMIVLPPFADKSTALGVRLHGIRIPGIDYDSIVYLFKESEDKETLSDQFKSYIMSTTVDDTGRVILSNKDRLIDEVISQYILAEYYQAKLAILDYKDILQNHSINNNEDEIEEQYKTALSICKKLMFMSLFSGDYVQNSDGTWTFKPFSIKKGSNKTDILAAEEMIKQFELIVFDRESLLQFVNRHVNGLMQREIEKLKSFGIVKKRQPNEYDENPRLKNVLLDKNILQYIYSAIGKRNWALNKEEDSAVLNEQAILIFMYDIVAKSIISKQESERLFTGQSNLYKIVRDKETRIITVPYQDQAKRIGSFASTGSVGVIEKEDYTCAEIADDMQPIEDLVRRSIYMNELYYCILTGTVNMSDHPGFDFRTATTEDLMQIIPNGYLPIIDKKVEDALSGFVLEKDGKKNKNNVTDGVSLISADFAKRLLKSLGAWNYRIARAFDILTSDKKLDMESILNSWETFSKVFTQVIGTLKYTAVGFRTEMVNGKEKVVLYVNKTALFPVFACMCNDKMNAIRRQMESQGVDMLMFESAVKVGAHGNSNFTVDNNGNIVGEFNTYSQKQFFLRKLLNTDPNEKEKMKIGILTVKVALSAAIGVKDLDWNGEKVDGDVIIEQIMNDIKRLTGKRYDKLMSKLSTQEDVIKYVTNFLRGNNVSEQTIDAFLKGIPAEALSILKNIDTLSAKRIQEDVVRIDSPGSAFIQRCVYGVEGPGVKFGNFELNDGEEFNIINKDGSMDCALSIDYFVEYRNGIPYFKLTPGRNKEKLTIRDKNTGEERPMSFEEIRAWLKKNNIIGKNAKASILSYRIPTQAVASINALKCVDVIPVVRDTVVLPKLFTTITGSDFDIDKLFISTIWYSMERQDDGSYRPIPINDTNTEEGCANAVVNDYIDILCATAKKRPDIFYRSIDEDTQLADDVIAFVKKLYPPTEEDLLDSASGILQAMPSAQARVHDEFLAGRLGVGPFALALVNHVLTRIYKVGFKGSDIYLNHKKLSTDTDDDGKSIMSWLSAMINKHADVAKNPDITYLNVNDSTFNVVALLLRLGYGRRTFMFTCQEIMKDYAFTINQETAVCKYTKNENGFFDARLQAYNEIIKKYKLSNVLKNLPVSQEDIYRAACLEIFDKNVSTNKSLCEYVLEHHGEVPEGVKIKIGKEEVKLTKELFQVLSLQLFNYLSDRMAKPLTKLQLASVIDNERCITSMIQSSFYEQAVQEVRDDDTFYNVDKLLDNSYIADKILKTVNGTNVIYNACSCMDKDVVTTIAKEIDPNILMYGKDRMNTFLGTVRDGMVAYYGAKFFDKYCKDNNINVQQLFKVGKNSIVRRLASILASAKSNKGKYKALRNNLLIKGLSIESIIGEQHEENPNAVFYNNHRFLNYEFLRFKYAGQSDDNILADVQLAWDQLLNHESQEIRNFARDLIVYSFYSSGEMPGMTKLFKYVPPSWRIQEGGYGDYFREISKNKSAQMDDIDDIIDKLCRNLWYKDKFVRTVGKYTLAKFEGSDVLKSHTVTIMLGEGEIGESEMRTESDPIFSPIIAGILYIDDENALAVFKGGKNKCPRYIKCVDNHHDKLTNLDDTASTWTLYKLVGFNTYMDKSGKGWQYPVYVQTSTLGEKYYRNNVYEYNEELEPNNNLDAYDITKEFISKLGAKVNTDESYESAIENLIAMLLIVNAGVNNAFEGLEREIATESVDILMNKDKFGKSTFEPLRPVNKSVDENEKVLDQQRKKMCDL